MKSNKLPASSGGIVQYYESDASKFEINPKQLVFITIIFVIIVLIMKWTNILGL